MASRREQAGLPKSPELRALVLDLLRTMAMPVNAQQIGEAVADHLRLTEPQRAVREPGTERSYVNWQAGWACNDLKWVGVCEQPRRGLYQLIEEGRTIALDEIERRHRERYRRLDRERRERLDNPPDSDEEEAAIEAVWQDDLLNRLKNVPPSAFEHLTAALLRSAGFDDVEVTGRSSDGGIDGIGTYRPSGLISFHTAFQCKRYQGSVGASVVRDFRGSFIGRADRGIIVTTGYFTREARAEASRPGANPVDLIDGEALCDLLKEHQLGVRVTQRMVEDITIDDAYFERLNP